MSAGTPCPAGRRRPTVVLLLLAIATTLDPGPAGAVLRTWHTVPGKSHVAFDARHPLGPFSGTAQTVAGEFRGDPADLKQEITGVLRVLTTSIRTGDAGRDRDTWALLEADRHPEIRFTLQGVEASFPSVSERADALLTIRGTLSVRGVERPLAKVFGRVRAVENGMLWVRGETTIRLTQFGITPPRRLLMRVDDEVLLRFDLTLAGGD